MFSASKLFRRNSLVTTILLVIGLLAATSIAAAIVGWLLLNSVSQSQNHISNTSLPLISSAQKLATQSATIALLAPQMTSVTSLEKLNRLMFEAEINQKSMEEALFEVDNLTTNDSFEIKVKSIAAEIHQTFVQIEQAMTNKIASDERRRIVSEEIRQQIGSYRGLLEEAILGQLNTVFEQSELLPLAHNKEHLLESVDQVMQMNLESEVLFQLSQNTTELASVSSSVTSSTTLEQVGALETKFDFILRRMISDSMTLESRVNAGALGEELSKVFEERAIDENLFVLQRNHIDILLEVIEINDDLQESVFQLNELTRELVNKIEVETNASSSAANKNAQLGTNILFGTAILSLIVSILAIWNFAIRKIALPLQEITSAMRKVSSRNEVIEIKSYQLYELNQISRALEVFRDSNIALEHHQKSLQENNAKLEKVNSDLNIFVHVASHDLQTPLRGIQVLSEFVSDDIKSDNHQSAFDNLSILQQRIARLSQLLESLLRFTKADANKGVAKPVDIGELIKSTFDLVIAEKKYNLVLPDTLPICKVIDSDLTVILLNLFENSVIHNDVDHGTIKISFSEKNEFYIFEVSDDGPGIETSYHKMIFEALKTLKPKDVVEGSGLGLSHIKRLLESRGGKIDVISNPQLRRGCRFVFYYPKLGFSA